MSAIDQFRLRLQANGVILKSDGVGITAGGRSPSPELLAEMKERRAELIASLVAWPFELPLVEDGRVLNPVDPGELLLWLGKRKGWPAVGHIKNEMAYRKLCVQGDMAEIFTVGCAIEELDSGV